MRPTCRSRHPLLRLSLMILAALLICAPVLSAAEIGGVRFAERLRIGQDDVRLRGVALLTWMGLVKLYAGGLYLPADQPSAGWAEDVPKALELSYFRAIRGTDFGVASEKLLRRALSEGEYQRLAERLQEIYRLFRDVKPGDRYTLWYHPGVGTELYLNDEPLGRIAGNDFARAYFAIWLGDKPISTDFRDRLFSSG